MALAAMTVSSSAATMLNTDFTGYADYDAAIADGWSQTTRNGREDDLIISATNGLQAPGWKQSTFNKALTGTVDLSTDNVYTISYRQLASVGDSARQFALTSATSSLVIGGSYNTNAGLYIGDAATNVLTSADWWSFQSDSGNPTIETDDTVSSTYLGSTWQNYEIVIAASSTGNNTLTLNVTTDGGTLGDVVSGHTYSFASSDVYDGAGFMLESGDPTAFSNVSITAVPEPSSTALLGLGGLALILRRRK